MNTIFLKKLLPLLFIFTVLAISVGLAQEKYKFGKISEDELKMTVFPNDSSAKAVVLYEDGKTHYNYRDDFQTETYVTQRIKILTPEGVDLGTVEIPYYEYGISRERITDRSLGI